MKKLLAYKEYPFNGMQGGLSNFLSALSVVRPKVSDRRQMKQARPLSENLSILTPQERHVGSRIKASEVAQGP